MRIDNDCYLTYKMMIKIAILKRMEVGNYDRQNELNSIQKYCEECIN